MQLVRRIIFILSFSVSALAQTTYSCPANQYVATQLVNTGQACSTLPVTVTAVSGATSGGFVVSTANPGSTPVVSVAPDGTHYLPTATDHTNWNAKQAPGNYITALTGDVNVTGPGSASAIVVGLNGVAVPASAALTGTDASSHIVAVATIPTAAPAAGQLFLGNAGGTAYAAKTASGDCAISSAGVFTCTKTSGSLFAPSATTDVTNASNISSGTINAARLPAGTSSTPGAVQCDGTTIICASGVISSIGGGTVNTQTAGAGGVTAHTFVGIDTSNPTKFIVAGSGSCGSGVALATASSGSTFALSDAVGTVQVLVDSGGVTAGHLIVGSTLTPGYGMDSGVTSSVAISAETTVCGTALATVTGGALVTMNPRSRGSYGHRTDMLNNASIPTSGGPTTTNPSGQIINLTGVAGLWGFGNSYMQGAGMASQNQTSYFALMARDTPAAVAFNGGVSATKTPTIVASVFSGFSPNPNAPSVTLLNGPENDGTGDLCGGTAGTNCTNNYSNSLMAAAAWASIPYQRRLMASTATKTGTWTVDNTLTINTNALYTSQGTGEKSSVSGSTLTFGVPSWSTTKIGITYVVTNAQAGSFAVSIDGAVQTDDCSSSATFSSGPCGGQALLGATSTFFRQEYSVTPNVTHTVVITTGSANNVGIVSVDGIPPANTVNTNAVFSMGTVSLWANYLVYNAATKAVDNQLQTDGLPVYYVDLAAGTPGMNTTTDVATSATATCSASLSGNHPNSCGNADIAATILNTENSVGYRFSSYQAGGVFPTGGQSQTPMRVAAYGSSTVPRVNAFGNVNTGAILGGAGIDFYNAGVAAYGVGFGQDGSTGLPWSSAFNSKLYCAAGGWVLFQLFDDSTLYGESHYTTKAGYNCSTGASNQLGGMSAPFVAGNSAAPTFTAGTGAGTAPTIALSRATSLSGIINVTPGVSPAASANVVTVTFTATGTQAYQTIPKCSVQPANAAALALVGTAAQPAVFDSNTTTALFVMTQGSTALTASTPYSWSYLCTQ